MDTIPREFIAVCCCKSLKSNRAWKHCNFVSPYSLAIAFLKRENTIVNFAFRNYLQASINYKKKKLFLSKSPLSLQKLNYFRFYNSACNTLYKLFSMSVRKIISTCVNIHYPCGEIINIHKEVD